MKMRKKISKRLLCIGMAALMLTGNSISALGQEESLNLQRNESSTSETIEIEGITVSSTYSGLPGKNVIDGNCSTIWHDDSKNQDGWIDLKLKNADTINRLYYLPRQGSEKNGIITSYEILVSYDDGTNYEKAAEGTWGENHLLKYADFVSEGNVTNVRLQNCGSVGGYASAAEIFLSKIDSDLPEPKEDVNTNGNWLNSYGTDGYVLCAYNNESNPQLGFDNPKPEAEDEVNLPDYIEEIERIYETEENRGDDTQYRFGYYLTGSNNVSKARLVSPDGSGTSKLNYWFDDRSMTLNIKVNDHEQHNLSLYFAENNRIVTVQAFEMESGKAIMKPYIMQDFAAGKYLTIPFSGDLVVKIENELWNNQGGWSACNAVLSGIFFDSNIVKSITIGAEDGEFVRKCNEEYAMKANFYPGFVEDKQIKWSISDLQGNATDIAAITEDGIVTTSNREGSFRVYAENPLSGVTASAEFQIIDIDEGNPPATTQIREVENFSIIENSSVLVIFDRARGTYSAYSQKNGEAYILNAKIQIDNWTSTEEYKFLSEEVPIEDALTTVTTDQQIKGLQGPDKSTVKGISGKTLRLTGTKEGQPSIVFDITLQDEKTGIILRPGVINGTTESIRFKNLYPMIAKASSSGGIFAGPDPTVNHDVMSGNSVWGTPSLQKGVTMGDARNNMIISYRENPKKESFSMGAITSYEFRSRFTTGFDEQNCLLNGKRKSIDAAIQLFDSRGKLVDENSSEPYMFDQAYVDFAEQNPYDNLEKYADEQARAMNVQLADIDKYFYECLWWAQGGHVSDPEHGLGYGGGVGRGNSADFAVEEAKRSQERGLTKYAVPSLRVEPDIYTKNNEQLWWNNETWKKFGHLTEEYPTLKIWNDAMHEAGGEAGLYMQPTYRSDDFCDQYPNYMLNNDHYQNADYTDADFIKYLEEEVYANLRDAGLTSMFYDYSGTFNYRDADGNSTQWYADGGHIPASLSWKYILNISEGYEDPYATAVSAYRNIFAIPKNIVGNQLQICENIWQNDGDDVAIGLVDSQRCVTDDTSFGLPLIRKGVYQWYKNRTTKMIYPDGKMIEQNDQDVRRGQVTGMAMMFGKPTLAHSLEKMSDEAIYDFSRTLPMPNNGVSARPLGLFELAGENDLSVNVGEAYDYKISDENHILMLWNHTTQPKTIGVDLGTDTTFGGMGLDPQKTYEVWDFWNWEYVGEISGSSRLELPVRKQECKVLAVREAKTEPQLLSTNRHILQGELDAKDVKYDTDKEILSGVFEVVADDEYKAIIKLPEGIIPDELSVSGEGVKGQMSLDRFDGYCEIAVNSDENRSVEWSLSFKKDDSLSDIEAPSDITGIKVQADVFGNVALDWNDSKDNGESVRYRVYRGTEETFEADSESLLAETKVSEYHHVSEAGEFYYKVEAYDPAGNSTVSGAVKAEIVFPQTIEIKSAEASSAYGSSYIAGNAIDQKENTIWHSADNDKVPYIILELEEKGTVSGLTYLPRQDSSPNGTIKEYEVQVSTDGGMTYQKIAEGMWNNDRSRKAVIFEESENVTHVKLVVLDGEGGFGSAAEIQLFGMADKISDFDISDNEIHMKKGEQQQLYVNVCPSYLEGIDAAWKSDCLECVTVDENGLITAIAPGEAQITASYGEWESHCKVIVEKSEPEELPYKDVEDTDWFYDDVCVMYNKGLMTGVDEVTFAPDQSLTRDQFAVILWRAEGSPAMEYTEKFADVAEGEWYTDAVLWASEQGIVTGYADTGLFGPADPISREQAAVMLYRYAKSKGCDVSGKADLASYEDADDIQVYAKEAMEWAVSVEILKGKGGQNILDPQGNTNRAEAAVILSRFMQKYGK